MLVHAHAIIIIYYRNAILPIQAELRIGDNGSCSDESVNTDQVENYIDKMNVFRDELFKDAKENIKNAQMKQKRDYDKKRCRTKVYIKPLLRACMHACMQLILILFCIRNSS